jgi:hypothetical protein
MPLIGWLLRGQGRARVEVKRYIELLEGCPNIPKLGHVLEADRIRLSRLSESVDQGTTEARVFDTARQFLGSTLGSCNANAANPLRRLGFFALFSAK